MSTIRRLWPFNKGGAVSPTASVSAADAALPAKDLAALQSILRSAQPGTRIQLDEVFVGGRIAPTEHEWYYGAKCRWCHRTGAAFRDPNDGQAKLSLSGHGEIHFQCHNCNGLIKVPCAQLEWFQFEG